MSLMSQYIWHFFGCYTIYIYIILHPCLRWPWFQDVASTTSIPPGSMSACSTQELSHRSCSQRIHRKSTRKRPSWMAESDLVYIAVQCRNSDGRHGTYRPRYHIFGYHESVRQSNWASVFASVPRSALDVEGWSICTSQERHLRRWENSFGYIWLAIRRAISISGWHVSKWQLNGFRNWCVTNELVGSKYRFEYVHIMINE